MKKALFQGVPDVCQVPLHMLVLKFLLYTLRWSLGCNADMLAGFCKEVEALTSLKGGDGDRGFVAYSWSSLSE